MIENRVTRLLGTKYPIVQGALGEVSESPYFVAAVSNAGALGVLAAVSMGAEAVRESIRTIRELTDKPFGVNILPPNPQYERILEIMIEEKVPAFCHGRYNPLKTLAAAQEAHCLSLPTVGSVKHAMRAEVDGADVLLVQGTEGGGHTGYVGTMVLVPAVVRKVKTPVIAAGGIATPEQFAAALCLGAEGIMMGTLFMMSHESPLHPNCIAKLIDATEEDTYATIHMSGRHQRFLVNDWAREKIIGRPEVKGDDHYNTFLHVAGKGAVEGDMEEGIFGCGEGIGLIDEIRSIEEIVEWMTEGVDRILQEKAKLVS